MEEGKINTIGGLRPVKPFREAVGGAPIERTDPGPRPELRWVKPTSLLVDGKYQRSLTDRSARLIAKIIKEFSWRKFKPCIVVDVGEGFHCIDGQHGAIAAATLGLPEIPVFVVVAASLRERAESFVSHNKDRVIMTPLDIFRARAAAQDPDALAVYQTCKNAGVILKIVSPTGRIDIGDTAAIGTIATLVKRQGAGPAQKVLESLVKGGRAPISAHEIKAVEAVMVLLRPATTVLEMASVIRALSDHGFQSAKMVAAEQGKPIKHALFEKYMSLLERQTGVARVVAD